jgi:predicted ATPase
VRLFVERARLVRPGFALTAENFGDVVELCRRLDGLPLAIELAAARTRLLGPKALLARIDSWLGEATPAVDRPERQRTLAATISWSHDLLSESDRLVFRRLGVFSSRVGLDAVEAVVGSEAGDPLDVVGHLVDVSLLEVVEGPEGEPMIYLLETIRRFARDRLEEHEEADEVRLRHVEWCVGVAHEISGLLHGPRQMSALDRMEAVIEDIRAALDWTLSPVATAVPERLWWGLALLQPMDPYWYRFGYVQEGRGWFERAITLLDRGDHGDSPDIVDALHGHGVLALQQNDLATGTRAIERALEMARRLGDLAREARESNSLGVGRREQGDVEGARRLIEHSIELARQLGDLHREVTAMSNMVHVHMDRGEYVAAVRAARRTVELDTALEDAWGVAVDHSNLVMALLYAEGPRPALQQLVEVALDAVALGDAELSLSVVDNFAAVWAALGDAERAATVIGAADAQRERAGYPRTGPDQALLDHFLGPLRQRFDGLRWERAYGAGRLLGIDAAVAEGLRDVSLPVTGAVLRETS